MWAAAGQAQRVILVVAGFQTPFACEVVALNRQVRERQLHPELRLATDAEAATPVVLDAGGNCRMVLSDG